MERIHIEPRRDWRQILEAYGFEHHSLTDDEHGAYWNESAYYQLSTAEVDRIEFATNRLEEMCFQLVETVIEENWFDRMGIEPRVAELIRRSWNADERSLYGRFDLSLGKDGSIKMLEYNADTPTSLFEAAVAQWQWLQDRFPASDQFNSIHEKLIEAWRREKGSVHFASLEDSESVVTTAYLEDTAKQAGVQTRFITMADIGFDGARFVDLQGDAIETAFKLYPWEWLLADEFGAHIKETETRFIEPAWKMVLSNKAMLPLLHELFPNSEYVLGASFNEPHRAFDYVRKPFLGREGANVQIVKNGTVEAETSGDYDGKHIYQEYHEGVTFEIEGRTVSPIIGSWIVDGESAGIGIREDYGVTTNEARFVPHLLL